MMKHALALIFLSASVQAAPVASPATVADNARLAATLDWEDRRDFEFASRGLLATPAEPVIRDASGAVLRDFGAGEQFTGPAPPTVNPSLWRNASLVAKHGLFEVVDGIWQVRGFDLSNMTIVRGKTGWIIIDPLTTVEAATAALALVNARLGQRPVVAVIYTHSHADHFGGAAGVVDRADAASGKVRVIAPEHFMEHAISENVIAGPAMTRRAVYMFGQALPTGPTAHVSSGLGPLVSRGTLSLISPNDSIKATGETRLVDGIRIEFQMTPDTEAPAEMNFYFPDFRALCMAENANGAMHNLLTPRGALVRDAKGWADYLLESRRLFAGKSDVVFTSHFWPRWESAEVSRYLLLHAQAYAFVHNESVRLMNDGLNAAEIAEAIALPAPLARAWYNRPNYGSLKFNARAVYQRYLGAFDGDPATLDPLPRDDVAVRYVAVMGGAKKVMGLAKAAARAGEDRWAATLLAHLVRAEPGNAGAREALAGRYEQLAFRAEAGPWRDFYLSGAQELRYGVATTQATNTAALAAGLQVGHLLDSMSVRVLPDKAMGAPFTVAIVDAETRERHLVTVANGVMLHEMGVADAADVTLTLPRMALIGLVGGQVKGMDLIERGVLKIDGDAAVLPRFMGLFRPPRAGFPLVTPLNEAKAVVAAKP